MSAQPSPRENNRLTIADVTLGESEENISVSSWNPLANCHGRTKSVEPTAGPIACLRSCWYRTRAVLANSRPMWAHDYEDANNANWSYSPMTGFCRRSRTGSSVVILQVHAVASAAALQVICLSVLCASGKKWNSSIPKTSFYPLTECVHLVFRRRTN